MENPEFFESNYFAAPYPAENRLSDAKPTEHFTIDDLLNFPNDDGVGGEEGEGDSSAVATPVGTSSNSSFSSAAKSAAAVEPFFQAAAADAVDGRFYNELCVPYDAELEWLSSFVDESFSSEDFQKLHLNQGMKARTSDGPQAHHHYHFQPEPALSSPTAKSAPAKAARSKRSRAVRVRGSWTSGGLLTASTPPPAISSSSESDITTAAAAAAAVKKSPKAKKDDGSSNSNNSGGGEGRRCLHCATDKTPQWRTGPMGPKTLCNACGVRFKSGRLVPEYRPAASPTFVMTKHSNSHRKVLELRRQKEIVRQSQQQQQQQQQQFMQHHHHHQSMLFDVSNGDDYLIHQHIGPDFRQLI